MVKTLADGQRLRVQIPLQLFLRRNTEVKALADESREKGPDIKNAFIGVIVDI